ncbi:MAG: carbohydrate ABC transporter permease [Eubacteriales bacterium]
MSATKIKRSTASNCFDVINYTFMIIFAITILFPIWNLIVVSLSDAKDVSFMSINLYPKNLTWDAYQYVMHDKQFYTSLSVSVSRAVVGTIVHLVICSLGAYSLSKSDLPFRKSITVILLIPMFFSGGLIPTYMNIKNLNLLDSFWVYIFPPAFSIFNTIILRNYMMGIDKSLEESAELDGANYLDIFVKITLPLSKPVLATVTLWTMVGQWNSWFDNLIYVRSESLLTLQYLLRRMMMETEALSNTATGVAVEMGLGNNFNTETIRSATTVLVILPIICVYPFLQKYFVTGLMTGAVKG